MPIDFMPQNQVFGERPATEYVETQSAEIDTSEVISAAVRSENSVVDAFGSLMSMQSVDMMPDPEYDPEDDIIGYEAYSRDLLQAVNKQDMNRMKNRIHEEQEAREVMGQASTTQGLIGMVAATFTDPTSFIPVAGAAYKSYRIGGRILEGAARTAGTAALIEAGREAYFHESQFTRTTEESIYNIAGATFLSGLLGSASASMSLERQARLAKQLEKDLEISPDVTFGGSSVGAAAARAETTLEQEGLKGLKKSQAFFKNLPGGLTNPIIRGSMSPSRYMRNLTERLGDTSLIKEKNVSGIASATSIENTVKSYDALKYRFYRGKDGFDTQYSAYKARYKLGFKKGEISIDEQIGSRKNGMLTKQEFSEQISKAMRRKDKSIVPEISFLAKKARNELFEPIKKQMSEVGLLTTEDLTVKTADSWIWRLWDKNSISARRSEFAAINLEHLKNKRIKSTEEFQGLLGELKIKDIDFDIDFEIKSLKKQIKSGKLADDVLENQRARLKILEEKANEFNKLRFQSAATNEELKDTVEEIIDRITGLPGGRLSYDEATEGVSKMPQMAQKRGSAKARVYDIPDEMVEDFLVNDIHTLIDGHIRTAAPDIELMREFGTLDFDVVKRELRDDYAKLINKAEKEGKSTLKIQKQRDADIKDAKAMWEKLRGTYSIPTDFDYMAPQNVTERTVLAWNYTRLLGGMALSSLADSARHVMVHGMTRTMRDGIVPLISNFKGFKASVDDLREMAVGLDMALSTTARSRFGMDDYAPLSGKVDRFTQGLSHRFGNWTLMNQWNTSQKSFAGVMTQNRMIKAITEWAGTGKIKQKEISNLASHGIDLEMSKRIAKQFNQHGTKDGNIWFADIRKWDDVDAKNTFSAAVRKQVDEIIVTPGLDKPLWMSRPGWRLIGQFRSFTFGSMQRVTLAGLQQADAATLNGLIMAVGMGSMVYALKNKIAGYPVSDDPAVWLSEGVDRAGVTGWFYDANNIVEKATLGTIGVNRLLGGPPMSRYASRNVTSALLGPTIGLIEDTARFTGAAASGDWRESDTRAARKLIPYQNVFYVRDLFDKMEQGVNNAFGVK